MDGTRRGRRSDSRESRLHASRPSPVVLLWLVETADRGERGITILYDDARGKNRLKTRASTLWRSHLICFEGDLPGGFSFRKIRWARLAVAAGVSTKKK